MGLVYDCIPLLIVLWFRALESPGLSLLGLSEVSAENMCGSSIRLKNVIVYQKNTHFSSVLYLGSGLLLVQLSRHTNILHTSVGVLGLLFMGLIM